MQKTIANYPHILNDSCHGLWTVDCGLWTKFKSSPANARPLLPAPRTNRGHICG